MREILFRGQSKRTQNWVIGSLIIQRQESRRIETLEGKRPFTNKYSIQHKNKNDKYTSCEVIEESIGQFTGQRDRNNSEIFEGDEVYIIPEDKYGFIKYDLELAKFVVIYDNIFTDFENWYGSDLEVIGNIYENPNLLEKENK